MHFSGLFLSQPSTSSSCSVAQSCPAVRSPMAAARQASLSFTISRSSLKPMSTELLTPSNHLILCRPLRLLPSIFPSITVSQLCTSGGQSIGASASTSVLPVVSFRIDWFDLLLSKAQIDKFNTFYGKNLDESKSTECICET